MWMMWNCPTKISPDPETVGRLHVFGKGRKSRWIPLNYKACRSLKTCAQNQARDRS